MLARLTEFSLSQRLLILGFVLLLVGAGTQAWRGLPIDAFPDVSTTQVKLILKAPGMTPEEVEARIAAPIETEMLGIPRQRILRSISKYGLTDITIDFEDGTDIYWARQQVAERLNGVLGDLPMGVSGGLSPITTPLSEMFMFTVEGEGLSLAERRAVLDWLVRPQLRTLPGVADVNALGGLVKTFEVVPDNAAMAARGVTLQELREAVMANNRNDGAGRLTEGEEVWLVRVEGAVRTLEELAAIVVKNVAGVPVRVADVAEVRLGQLTRYGGVTQNGRGEAVQGLVLGLKGANAQQVVAAVKQRLKEIAPSLPKGVEVRPFYDRSALVDRAVGTVARALLEATVLVLLLLFLFLGNVRAALAVALTLPLAALATFLLMRQFGLSANLMSLGGLAIAIGLLVDGAVVVVENIVSHLAHNVLAQAHAGEAGVKAASADGRSQNIAATAVDGYPKLHQVFRAVREVATPTAAGVLIIMIVFLPLLTLEGLEGKLFIPVALTIVFALGAALLLSLSVVPVLASYLLKEGAHEEPWLVRWAIRLYTPVLDYALARVRIVLIAAVALLAAAAAMYPFIGKSFMPTLDEGDLLVQLEKLPSISLEESLAQDMLVQRALMQRIPEIKGVVARAGADELGLDPMGLNETDSFLVLKPMHQWREPSKDWLMDEIRKVMADFPGINYAFTQPIDMRVSEMLTGSRGELAVKIFGTDIGELNRLADQVEAVLKPIPGAQDVFSMKNEGVQYFQVEVDRLAAGRYGLSVDDVSGFLRAQLEGVRLGLVQEGGRRTPLVLRAGENVRASPALFEAMRIPTPSGLAIPLREVARLKRTDGPVAVKRENAVRYVTVQSNVAGRDLVGFVEEARARIARQVKLPEGYRVAYGGQFENQQRAAARLAIVVPVALLLIFALLFATFGSVRQAVLILANVPFALVGGVAGLFLTGEYLSVPASVGFIALLGIAVLNGVVMVSHFNQLAAQGLAAEAVVREGALRRLRPVLMTASIAAFGLIPLLLATGPGSEIQKPLAIVVVGGLFSSTLLTLILLPVLYRRFILGGTLK
ncbi:cobalt-zinc-cadmium resistance protein CzcA [Sulfuritortus calidifontis]|uniref:Cobalt-zinc-cadmium resistance protein CzcA n=1 Tax=Sulfuritortus calidifontis TaxID=1914471 RepID=A0A4R3JS73_9PROT|nr:CusA/CzcA family heavy metal efflux RND transporter [Sulfuritortus calidifontis]TCS70015.1 cobalt-zinc-cadmium resistance protein CzcA [Sulfuritortus calidifontis]